MSTEENKALVRRYEDEKRNKNNLAIIDELVADGVVMHDQFGDQRVNLAVMKANHAQQRVDWPDLSIEIGEMIAEGDMVAYLWTLRGTHSRDIDNPWGHFPATGKVIAFSATTICRIANGKIVEIWNRGDHLSFVEQLGGTVTLPQAAT